MKTTVLMYLVLSFFLSCNAKNPVMKTFEIYFQDGFSDDTVTMILNDCSVFEGLVLNSAADIGLTNIIIKAELKGKEAKVSYNDRVITCLLSDQNKIIINLLVNNVKTEHILDLSKGKYIGFEMSSTGIYSSQSKIPFEYD